MKKKSATVIGMVVCFMMMATFAWALDLPGLPNGTVKDGNLIWLKNANCFGRQNWQTAMNSAAGLKSGMCGLTDGSRAGQWRLPTKEELQARQKNQSGFNNIQDLNYWSSSSYAGNTAYAWYVGILDGYVNYGYKDGILYVWPVRARTVGDSVI